VQTHEQDDALAHGVRAANYRDFADTAEQLMAMRHVVTVDTAVAHLAGAIGHPSLHLLVPHVMYWPWYRAADWYPRINVYRQPRPGNWDSVFAVLNFNLWSCQ
jgi:ADP-heptose:LPS heptosyltransferase